jgi:hypothetical protein
VTDRKDLDQWLQQSEWVNEPEPDWTGWWEDFAARWTPNLTEDPVTAADLLDTSPGHADSEGTLNAIEDYRYEPDVDWAPLDIAIAVHNSWQAGMSIEATFDRVVYVPLDAAQTAVLLGYRYWEPTPEQIEDLRLPRPPGGTE